MKTSYSINPNGTLREYNIKTGETVKFLTQEEYNKKIKIKNK